jgi:tetratricopeptide (TPR) repeat protein
LVQHADTRERACVISARGTELQPHLASAWFSHGHVLNLASRHQEAIAAFTTGWRHLPQGEGYVQATPAVLWLGECYWAIGDPARALACWKKATRLACKLMPCDPAMAFYWQGKAWLVLGETAAARQALQTALLQQLLYPARQEAQHILTCGREKEVSYANRAGFQSDTHNGHPGSGESVASKAQDDLV